MYDQENNHSNDDRGFDSSSDQAESTTSESTPTTDAKQPAEMLSCPYCRKTFDRSSTKAMPFCSSRCRMIDLGLWLNEVHSMPSDDIDSGEYGAAE